MSIERLYRDESGRILATLIRLVGDFDLAEEVDARRLRRGARALAAATASRRTRARGSWRRRGTRRSTASGATSASARSATSSRAERRSRSARRRTSLTRRNRVADDRLRLIFTCCHPALAVEAQVALTLRTLGGLTTEEIARAFLVPRADDGAAARAREEQDPGGADPLPRARADELAERLDAVLARRLPDLQRRLRGDARATELVRRELCGEAIRLGACRRS